MIETIAEAVHDSWWQQKIKDGYHHPSKCPHTPDSRKNIQSCRFCNLNMVPYSELTDLSKEYDRITVRTVLKALEQTGYTVCKVTNRQL